MIRDNLSWQPIQQKTAIIYEYLAQCAEIFQPEFVTNEVRYLFVQGKVETPEIVKALKDILASDISDREFSKFINCCFHIVINIWLTQPEAQEYIPYLITVFDELNPRFKSYDRTKAKLTQLILQYQVSESYLRLRSLVEAIDYDVSKKLDKQAHVASLIHRYPYLYKHYFLENNYIPASEALISKIQGKNQKRFEFQLSQYIIYQIRLLQVARLRLLSQGAGKVIKRVKNPTLLSDKDFKIAIKHYIGKIDGEKTLLQISQKLTYRNKLGYSYQDFKQELQQYLINNFQPKNKKSNFAEQLKHKIASIFPQSDNRVLNNSLILQTCRQLLSFLVIETSNSPNINQFNDLVANFGTAQAVLLLVKIVLICPEVIPDLEKKIMILFTYYQEYKLKEVIWLVKSLEYLSIAFSIYFGNIDVSLAKTTI